MRRQDIDTYRELKISTMNQKELIVFLYDSAIKLIISAKEKIVSKDVTGRQADLNRARNIFLHLLATLDLEAGGEFARKLSALYAFFIEKITVANATESARELDEITPMIEDIKSAWESAKFQEEPASVVSEKSVEAARTVSLEV